MKPETIMKTLDRIYGTVLDGIPHVAPPVTEWAERRLRRSESADEAALHIINSQLGKCAASGFVTGLGGIVTMPVALPLNLATVLYFQLRMIAALAYLGGYDLQSPQVRSLSYVCLAGLTMEQVLKNTGIKIGTRLTKTIAAKLPARLTVTINQKVGYRLFTKFGGRSALSVGKAVPLVGGVISGTIDYVESRAMAERAYRMFIEGTDDFAAGFAEYEILDED